jgi:aspartate racemase
MKIAGIIGGTGPESTVDYYRQIIALYRERNPDGNYPTIIINSINMKIMLDLVAANKLEELTDFLAEEVQRLARAGATFGLLAANTSHIVFDALMKRSPIPLISIIETACTAAVAQDMKRIGLFGTRFTMEGRFYPDVFERSGMTLVVPSPDERTYIHDKYMNELVNGIVLSETRDRLTAIARRMKAEEGIDGLALGGTELSLIIKDSEIHTSNGSIPVLDTTKLHIEETVSQMLS